MTVALLRLSDQPILSITADVLIVGVSPSDDGPVLHSDLAELADLAPTLGQLGITGSDDELRRLPAPAGFGSLALIGLGRGPVTANSLRRAAGSAARQLTGVTSLAISLPATTEDEVLAVLEGAALGSYSFDAYRSTPPDAARQPASEITVAVAAGTVADGEELVQRATIVARAVHTVRDLINTPPSDLYPETFADAVGELSAEAPVTVTVLAEDELAEQGYGGILAAGKGSSRGPRLVKVEYSPDGATKHLALVGKGITFDSGGLSLKPGVSMVGMKYDMSGAATVFAVLIAAAQLRLNVRITAWLCLAENLPSGTAMRPNDVLRIYGGKTVEVLNTDAEGRLVLADALVAASEEQPDAIIDVATLTGAAIVALGERYTGAMGDTELVERLVGASNDVGELMWHMPLPEELRPMLSSSVADIANVKAGSRVAGMLVGGVFLQEFIGNSQDGSRIPWAHLDIAGPANNEGGGYGFTGKGPTGVTVRSLLELAEQFSRP